MACAEQSGIQIEFKISSVSPSNFASVSSAPSSPRWQSTVAPEPIVGVVLIVVENTGGAVHHPDMAAVAGHSRRLRQERALPAADLPRDGDTFEGAGQLQLGFQRGAQGRPNRSDSRVRQV